MNEEIEFKYAIELGNNLNGFLVESKEIDVKEYILEQTKMRAGVQNSKDLIETAMKKQGIDYVFEYNEGRLNSHLLTPVVQFYNSLLSKKDHVKKYMAEIERINILVSEMEAK